VSTALVRVCDQHEDLAGEDRHFLVALLSPAVGHQRATEIAAKLSDKVDLLHIAKEDAVYFQHLDIEPAAIATLTAAFDLSARLAEARITDRPVLENAEHVAQFLVQRYRLRDQEVFGALFLDTGGRLISAEDLFKGSGVQRQLKLPVRRQLELPVATSRRGASDVGKSQLVDRAVGLDA